MSRENRAVSEAEKKAREEALAEQRRIAIKQAEEARLAQLEEEKRLKEAQLAEERRVKEEEKEKKRKEQAEKKTQWFEPKTEKFMNDSGFWMGKYETTIAQYMACVDDGGCSTPEWLEKGNANNNDSSSVYSSLGESTEKKNYPIVWVSQHEANNYVQWLSKKTNRIYRLPTSDEWLTACQAVETTDYCGGNNLDLIAWYDMNSESILHAVGQKKANAWGLFDMSGNVAEWTSQVGETNQNGIIRGGGANDSKQYLLLTDMYSAIEQRSRFVGFRVLRESVLY